VCDARVRSAPRVLGLFFSRALLSRVLRGKTTVLQFSFGHLLRPGDPNISGFRKKLLVPQEL